MKELVGRFAISTAGHDNGRYYVIVTQKEDMVYLCDGKHHTLDKKKKKAIKHICVCEESVSQELFGRIMENEKIFDHEIKYAIKQLKRGKTNY